MSRFVVLAGMIFFSVLAHASVCSRAPQIVSAIEESFKKNCTQITDKDLAQVYSLDLSMT